MKIVALLEAMNDPRLLGKYDTIRPSVEKLLTLIKELPLDANGEFTHPEFCANRDKAAAHASKHKDALTRSYLENHLASPLHLPDTTAAIETQIEKILEKITIQIAHLEAKEREAGKSGDDGELSPNAQYAEDAIKTFIRNTNPLNPGIYQKGYAYDQMVKRVERTSPDVVEILPLHVSYMTFELLRQSFHNLNHELAPKSRAV
jgi:hypothetical protein